MIYPNLAILLFQIVVPQRDSAVSLLGHFPVSGSYRLCCIYLLGGKKRHLSSLLERTERAIMWHVLDFKKWKEREAFNCMGNLIRFRLIKFIFYINMFTNIIASR